MIVKSSSPQLLDVKSYVADLTRAVTGAKTRVDMVCTVLADDRHTHELMEALIHAAGRGVRVSVAADIFTFGEFGGYFSPFQRFTSKSREISAMADRLRAAGITFTWFGDTTYRLNPFGGVTHLKWTVVDATAYCFGGVNLYDFGIENVDYMFKFSDAGLAEQISRQHQVITKTTTSRSRYAGYKAACDYGTVYIDSGKPGDSMIYDRLVELAQAAEHTLVVTQYCPSGPLARHLHGKSDVYYNQPSDTEYPVKLLLKYGELRTGLHSQYHRGIYLHAKFMIFTMPGGKKIAVTGSHNFSYSGVLFGTREVALETSDPSIITQLEQFHQEYVA